MGWWLRLLGILSGWSSSITLYSLDRTMMVVLLRIIELSCTFRVVIDRHEQDMLLLEYNEILLSACTVPAHMASMKRGFKSFFNNKILKHSQFSFKELT